MKKLLISLMCISLFGSMEAQHENHKDEAESAIEQEKSYILRMRFPDSVTVPPLGVFYKGSKLDASPDLWEHSYVIKAVPSYSSLCIVIAEDISINGNSRTIKQFQQIPFKKYRMFYLIKTDESTELPRWTIEEESPENIPHILPQNALVILFPPYYIERLRYPRKEEFMLPFRKENLIPSKCRNFLDTENKAAQPRELLPLIEIKKEITQDAINRIYTAPWCATASMQSTKVTKKNRS